MVIAVFAAAMFAVLALTTATGSTPLLVAAPELVTNLGVSSATAAALWSAFNSPWALALSVALVPLGFGAWAITIRLTFQMLIRTLGIVTARRAAVLF